MTSTDQYRLPRTAVPSHYDITLEPELEDGTFSGFVAIQIELTQPANQILLNALDLHLDEVWLDTAAGRIDAEPIFESKTERCRLKLSAQAPAGEATLYCLFNGELNDRLVGFYRSRFTDRSGTEHLIATTQLESTHARRAFPCWDEPELKATFSVALVVPQELTALSNGAELSAESDGKGKRKVQFATTMKMSTYLVAFIVGPLELTDSRNVDGIPLRVSFPPGKETLTDFALDTGAFALGYYTDYYGIAYPADKLDLVAIPDFAFGAMENTGCVTFRETALLIDPSRATQQEMQRVADVVHHEIAHMWFGNLVTMKWWNGLWLNEAFATFMEMKCTDAFRPGWQRWVAFGVSRTAAFDVDSLSATRPIEFEVVSPEDAEGMFDILTYEKGAAVLRMLEQYLGEEAFRKGVRHYLSTHAYGNTDTTDLWDSIQEATGEPVRRIMDSWIFQGGHPLIKAQAAGTELRLSQQVFRYAGAAEAPDDRLWSVPVMVRYGRGSSEQTVQTLLEATDATLELAFEPDWVVVNRGAHGFFRTAYSPELQNAVAGLGATGLDAAERYQLVDDSFAAVLAGQSSAASFLELAETLADEDDLSVWQRICGGLGSLERILDENSRAAYQARVRSPAHRALVRLGDEPGPGEDQRTSQLRGTLFEFTGTVGNDPQIRTRARELHDRYRAEPGSVDPALAAAAIGVMADAGTPEEFDLFWRCHTEADSPQLAIRYLHALARFDEPELVARMLQLARTEVRTQDAPFLLGRGLANRRTNRQVFEFIRQHWQELTDRFPSNSIVRMVSGISTFTDPDLASAAQDFFDSHPIPQSQKTLAQHLEKMWVSVAFRQREAQALAGSL
ncbi:MAG: M1 family metallopeptidase [Actinomycetota bacterium]